MPDFRGMARMTPLRPLMTAIDRTPTHSADWDATCNPEPYVTPIAVIKSNAYTNRTQYRIPNLSAMLIE